MENQKAVGNAQYSVIEQFYAAFAQRDATTMVACYHPQASFSDPIFINLRKTQINAMWHMLCSRASDDFLVKASDIRADGLHVTARWQAHYTFSSSGRRVHNDIHAQFELMDGLIRVHRDHFSLYRWAIQALGLQGLLFGWLPPVQNKIRIQAMSQLAHWQAQQVPF